MSLINDALKNAKRAQEQQPPGPPGAPPLLPVETPARGGGMMWFVLFLFILGIAGVFIGLALVGHKSPAPTPPTLSMEPPAPPPAPKPTPVVAPLTNAVAAKAAPPALKLQGIFVNARSQAIVNGQTVYVGDSVNGFRVKTISQTSVSFVAPDGTETNLALGK